LVKDTQEYVLYSLTDVPIIPLAKAAGSNVKLQYAGGRAVTHSPLAEEHARDKVQLIFQEIYVNHVKNDFYAYLMNPVTYRERLYNHFTTIISSKEKTGTNATIIQECAMPIKGRLEGFYITFPTINDISKCVSVSLTSNGFSLMQLSNVMLNSIGTTKDNTVYVPIDGSVPYGNFNMLSSLHCSRLDNLSIRIVFNQYVDPCTIITNGSETITYTSNQFDLNIEYGNIQSKQHIKTTCAYCFAV